MALDFGPYWFQDYVGDALPQTDPVCNLGLFLDSQYLLDDQVALVARRVFAQLLVCQML